MKPFSVAILIAVLFTSSTALSESAEEVLLGITVRPETLDLHVASGGCTKKEDFNIDVNKGTTGLPPYQVTVTRIKPDHCEALSLEGVNLSFDRKKLGLDGSSTFRLTNEIGNFSPYQAKIKNHEIKKLPISSIIGKYSRIYKTGEALTEDFRPERVNIELDNNGNIVNIWKG
ncbi:I78 family peptidase inhibitor [Microbulbifer sp. VTAC004]|uniref:I78 family peptidase inhibitor n=1 Tax=unclassified Microbulbifer TaxID=2619833 RepID=UPI00403984CF